MSAAVAQQIHQAYRAIGTSDDRDAWLGLRRSGIGASEAAIILGECRWKSAPRLAAEKIGRIESEQLSHEWLEWGLRHEPAILDAYSSSRYAGRKAWRAGELLRSSVHPWALATLDAWCVHPEHGQIPLELKTNEIFRAEEWEDGPPREYLWQLQHQMLVTDAPAASIACLLGVHRFVWCDVVRDKTMIRRLIHAGREFWACVEHDDLPPGPMDGALVQALWPKGDGSDVDLDGRFIDLDHERATLTEQRKAAEARLKEIDDELKAAIGPATRGLLPGGRVAFSFREQSRAEHVVKASSFRVLRRHAAKEG